MHSMRCLALATLLYIPRTDIAADKKTLLEALTAAEKDLAIEKALKSLCANDDAAVPAALGELYEKAVELLRTNQKDVIRWAKEMDDQRLTYDAQGRYVRGRADLFGKAEEQWQFARQRTARLDTWTPRLATALMGLKTEQQHAGLLKLFTTSGDFYVRGCAALALGKTDSKEALDALIAAAKQGVDSTLRVALLDALASRAKENKDVRDFVLACLAGDWQVQVTALKILKQVPDKAATLTLITMLKGAGGRIRNEANDALMAITSINKHGDYEAWKAWWDKNNVAFMDGTYVPNPAERADAKGGSAFYGVAITSTRVVFLVDTSSSMSASPTWVPQDFAASFKGEATRLDVLKYELKKMLLSLPDSTEFNLINFHTFVHPYQPKLVRMDSGQRKKAIAWVDAQPFGIGTVTWDGITECYQQAGGNFFVKNVTGGLDTIYLMSDGIPEGGVNDAKTFEEKLTAINRFKKLVIHTIAVDPPPGGEDFMKMVADATGGTYVRR